MERKQKQKQYENETPPPPRPRRYRNRKIESPQANMLLFYIGLLMTMELAPDTVTGQALIHQQALGVAGSAAVKLVDWDMDGDLDAIVTNAPPELKELWINDGRGRFSLFSASNGQYDVFPPFYVTEDRDVDVGDMDGDGLMDVLFPINGVYLNRLSIAPNGSLTFATQRVDLPTISIQRSICRLVDLDGDGDLDVYLGRGFFGGCCADELFINSDGLGNLTASAFSLGPANPSLDIVFRDINGDGAIDAVLCHGFHQNASIWRSYAGDNLANFTFVSSLGVQCDGLDIGDIDGDGEDDLILVEFGGLNSIWKGYGNFTFLDTGLRPGNSSFSGSVRLGDLNGNGDLDAVIANTIGALVTGEPNEVLINVDGLGTMVLLAADPLSVPDGGSLGKWFSTRPALGDLDGDGSLDLFESNSLSQPNRVYTNVGNGLLVVTNPAANTSIGNQIQVQFNASGKPGFYMVPLAGSLQFQQDNALEVSLETIREVDGITGTVLKQVDLTLETFTIFNNPSLGDSGLDYRTSNGSLGESYEFRFSLFQQAARISFGEQSYDIDADVNKITLCVGFWPFVNLTTSRLEFDILFQPQQPNAFQFLSNTTDPTAAAQGLERTIFQTTSQVGSVVITLLQTVAIDGLVISDNFTRTYSRPAFSNQTQILLTLAFPAFEVELEYDPDVAVLIDSQSGNSNENSESLIIGLVTAAGVLVCVIVIGIVPVIFVGLFLWVERFRIKAYFRNGGDGGDESIFHKSIHLTEEDISKHQQQQAFREEEFVELSDSD